MEVNLLEYVQFQYGYRNRLDIEKSNEKSFEILINKNNLQEDKAYILYNKKIFEANFNEDTNIVIIQKNVYEPNEIESIKKKYTSKKYETKELYKLYTGFKLSNLDYVKYNEIAIQSENEKDVFYIEPQIIIENNKATIIKNNEVIGRVNDARSITLLKAMNKQKDIVTVKGNILNSYTFKQVSKHQGKLKVKVTTNEKLTINNVIRRITQGCRFNENEVWLFLSDDPTSITENSMLLILPDNTYCKCLLDGNELKLKQIINRPRTIRGKSFLLKVNTSDLEFEEEDFTYGDKESYNDGFNDVIARKSSSIDFINMIKDYEKTENEILHETKVQCGDLKYSSIDKDKLIISTSYIPNLEQWSNRLGISVCYKQTNKEHLLGTLKEVGENYIRIDFKDDMIRSSIPRNGGSIGISLFGDEIIHKRRAVAIDILENNSAAIENLSGILNGTYELETFLYEYMLEKYEIGSLSDMQVDAVEGSLNTPDIFLIQGPPGAGKTTVIRNIVKKILENNQEVLITSFQNLAVDNVLDGFLKSNIIPYRFGDEDNPVMQKICSEISQEINELLKDNISKDKEEDVQLYKEKINASRGKILGANDKDELSKEIEIALEYVKDFEGISTKYLSLSNIYEDIKGTSQPNSEEFSIDKIKAMMPEEFGYDFEILEKFENTQNYLQNINKTLESKTIENIINKLIELQDPEVLFTLEDKEYQKMKHWIFDELKLVKNNKTDDFDIFGVSIEVACILDDIIEDIPEFIEDEKYKIIKEFHNKISNNPILLEDVLKKYPDIRGTTCQKTGSGKFNNATKGINYDYVIVDEAGRANPLDLLIPLIKGYKIILVGDHKQLPHMIENHVENRIKENGDFNEELYEKYIKESLFGRLFEQLPGNRKVMLDTQYRMSKEIGDLVSTLFYNGDLKTGTTIVNDTSLYKGKSLVSINVKGVQKKTPAGSWLNTSECEEIIAKLIELDESQDGVDKKISVGIISFYKAQVEYIKNKINKLIFKNINVDVGTVDAYQGLEKDIIFISSVRTNGIGFISNPNRLNVSLSRAKKLVVIFGDLNNLNKDKLFKQILEKCSDGGESHCI